MYCPPEMVEFLSYRDELSVINGIIFKGSRILIPRHLRKEMLRKFTHDTSEFRNVESEPENCIMSNIYIHNIEKKQQTESPSNSQMTLEKGRNRFIYLCHQDYLIVINSYSNYPKGSSLSMCQVPVSRLLTL